MVVVCFGLLFIVPPALTRGLRALGLLFIPGAPILTTGAILLFASVFDAWERLWPLEVMSLATGFLLANVQPGCRVKLFRAGRVLYIDASTRMRLWSTRNDAYPKVSL